MDDDAPEWEIPRVNGNRGSDDHYESKFPLWWMFLTAPIVSFVALTPVEAISGAFGFSLLYLSELPYYLTCWTAVTLVPQFVLATAAFMMAERKFEWLRLLGMTLLTSLGGVILCYLVVMLLFAIVIPDMPH